MTEKKPSRKRRSDRNHVIYRITCVVTGEQYIGITVARGRAYKKSMMIRWIGHVHHALVELRPYLLHKAIRQYGPEAFTHELIDVVRGKKAAHEVETSLIKDEKPALNMESMGRKASPRRKRGKKSKEASGSQAYAEAA